MTYKRDIGKEILDGLQLIKMGKGRKFSIEAPEDIKEIRENLHLSQMGLSSLMGVSVRTLQEWEQGRRKPTGPAKALLRIARDHPDVFLVR